MLIRRQSQPPLTASQSKFRAGDRLTGPKRKSRLTPCLHDEKFAQRMLLLIAVSSGRELDSSQLRKMIFVIRLDMDKDLCDALRRAENCVLRLMSDTLSLAH